jgi:hypothetical protein
MIDGPNRHTWDAQLLSYWFSRNPAVFQDSFLRHREFGRDNHLSAPARIVFFKNLSATFPILRSIQRDIKNPFVFMQITRNSWIF